MVPEKRYYFLGDYTYTIMRFQAMSSQSGVTSHIILKELGLYPISASLNQENMFVRNYGERIAVHGASRYDDDASGLWELCFHDSRDFIFPDIGSAPLLSEWCVFIVESRLKKSLAIAPARRAGTAVYVPEAVLKESGYVIGSGELASANWLILQKILVIYPANHFPDAIHRSGYRYINLLP
jgi:hypothetical protein